MPTALDTDGEVTWIDRTRSGYRACARIGDIYVVYLLTGGQWRAVTAAMTHKQAETYHHHTITPTDVGPGLGAWLDREVAALADAAGQPRPTPQI